MHFTRSDPRSVIGIATLATRDTEQKRSILGIIVTVPLNSIFDRHMAELVKRRRRWTKQRKREIVAESFDPGTSLQAVAARHDINPSQLSHWRKLFREQLASPSRIDDEARLDAGQPD
ncbi:transposase [Burkholderia sp. Ac-20379]|nr:transposase [Burkholderia sp. Ac-20379]